MTIHDKSADTVEQAQSCCRRPGMLCLCQPAVHCRCDLNLCHWLIVSALIITVFFILVVFMAFAFTCEYKFTLIPFQSVINLRLMTEVTKPGPLSAPILTKTVLKSHFVSVTLPLDCVVCTGRSDTIKEYVFYTKHLVSYH